MDRNLLAGTMEPAFAAALLTLLAGLAHGADPGSRPCPWEVKPIREATEDERAFETRLPYGALDPDRTDVPGPDSARLVVRRDAQGRPTVYLERPGGGSRSLVAGWSFFPSWSPDGRHAACLIWRSDRRSDLAIVRPESGDILSIDSTVAMIDYRWSPDSRFIAAYGRERWSRRAKLVWIDVAGKRSRTVDRLLVEGEYELAWSPDSKRLAYTRTTSVNIHGEPSVLDLWVAGERGRRKCRVVATPDLELKPVWLSNEALRYTKTPAKEGHGTNVIEMVVEFAPSGAAKSSTIIDGN